MPEQGYEPPSIFDDDEEVMDEVMQMPEGYEPPSIFDEDEEEEVVEESEVASPAPAPPLPPPMTSAEKTDESEVVDTMGDLTRSAQAFFGGFALPKLELPTEMAPPPLASPVPP